MIPKNFIVGKSSDGVYAYKVIDGREIFFVNATTEMELYFKIADMLAGHLDGGY